MVTTMFVPYFRMRTTPLYSMARAYLLAAALASLAASAASAGFPGPAVFHNSLDSLELRSGFVRVVFNLTRGSLDVVQGCFAGTGDFSASPNLAGDVASPDGVRRGAVSVVVMGLAGGEVSTSSANRPAPLAFTILSNDTTSSAGFSVVLSDSSALTRVTLSFGLDVQTPRRLVVNASATALAGFSPSLVALSTTWTPPNAVGWYAKGVRQGMQQRDGFIASTTPWVRWYVIGDGATGAVEALPLTPGTSAVGSSYMYAGSGSKYGTRGGLGLALFGAANPVDNWAASYDGGAKTNVALGAASPTVSIAFYPNQYSFPASEVPAVLPPFVVVDDLRSILTGVHGAVVSALHSYDFAPEVRAAPCLVINGNQCYGEAQLLLQQVRQQQKRAAAARVARRPISCPLASTRDTPH